MWGQSYKKNEISPLKQFLNILGQISACGNSGSETFIMIISGDLSINQSSRYCDAVFRQLFPLIWRDQQTFDF